MTRLRLLLYLPFDWIESIFARLDARPLIVSEQRVLREVKNQEIQHADEASIRCMYRVKERMKKGSACGIPPYYVRNNREASPSA